MHGRRQRGSGRPLGRRAEYGDGGRAGHGVPHVQIHHPSQHGGIPQGRCSADRCRGVDRGEGVPERGKSERVRQEPRRRRRTFRDAAGNMDRLRSGACGRWRGLIEGHEGGIGGKSGASGGWGRLFERRPAEFRPLHDDRSGVASGAEGPQCRGSRRIRGRVL